MILLDARTHFSLGESVITPEELVKHAKEKGYTSVAMCDTMNISGMIDFSKRCKEAGIKPIVGCRLRIVPDPTYRKPKPGEPKKDNGEYYLKVWIRNQEGFKAVMRLISKGLSEEYFYYKARIGFEDLLSEIRANPDALLVTTGDFNSLMTRPKKYIEDVVADILHVDGLILGEVVPLNTPFWDAQNAAVARMFYSEFRIVSWPALYLDDTDADALTALTAISGRGTVADRFTNKLWTKCHKPISWDDLERETRDAASRLNEHYDVKTPGLFMSALVNTKSFHDRIDYKFEKMPVSLPEMAPAGTTEMQVLISLCKQGWNDRLMAPVLGYKPPASALPAYKERLEYELRTIKKQSFERYFLIVQDLVRWSKEQGIAVGPGRGSVGGSLAAYLLGITDVDPIRFNLLFERFINPERIDLPDADLDFQSTRREEIITYLVDKYGRDKVAGISNFTTMASGSAMRDVGRVMGMTPDQLEPVKLVPKEHGKPYELTRAADEVPQLDAFRSKYPKEWNIATRLEGVMRSFGRHAAGVIVAGEPISTRAVVETHRGDPVVNWDKVYVEDLGLVKMDILGLSTLDVIQMACSYIKERTGKALDMLSIPLDDPEVMRAFGEGETVGIFQFESAGMRKLLRDIAAAGALTFDDLSAATALYRPGPMDSGMLDDYVAWRQGLKRPSYDHSSLEAVLGSTGGVVCYQEQTMQLARVLCGFTGAEADGLRKAIGKKKPEEMAKYKDKFIDGALKTSGISKETAERIWSNTEKNASYQFNLSHSVEYSVISYQTMYLKVRYPAEFYAANLSVLGDDKLEGLVRDARRRGVEIAPPRLNFSTQRFEIISEGLKELKAILVAPFNRVKGISENVANAILEARKRVGGKFRSVDEFVATVNKTKCNIRHRGNLELIGAFADLQPGTAGPLHPDRRKDQMTLMPGLIIDAVKADRVIEASAPIKDMLVGDIVRPINACKNCSLAGGVHPTPRLGKKPKFMVVTDSPNYSEEKANKMLEGKASNFLKWALDSAGLSLADGYFTSLVKSPKSGKMLSNEQVNGCSKYLKREIEILKPPVILALGSSTVNFLVPGLKGGAMENAGRIHYDSKLDCNVVVGFNPAMIAFTPEKQSQLNELMATVAELVE